MKLKPELLLRAYAVGIFPMAESRAESEIHWIDPELRGVLPLDGLHISKRLRRTLRSRPFEVHADSAFDQVIKGCATPAPDRRDTWINPSIERLYTDLHHMGFAHSVECWQDGELVGGLYGVSLGAAFFGESMFSRARDASKVALVHLVHRLRQGGFLLLDTQFQTPHLSRLLLDTQFQTPHLIRFGVVEISRDDYRAQLSRAIRRQAQFPVEVSDAEVEAFVQSITQTS